MKNDNFTLKYNVTGSERQRLVRAISEITGAESKYMGAPSFAYEVDYFTIDRSGNVAFDSRADTEEIENLTRLLQAKGALIKKALGIEDVSFIEGDGKVSFNWFKREMTADVVRKAEVCIEKTRSPIATSFPLLVYRISSFSPS